MTDCLIAFGANQGDRWATWTRTIEELERVGFENCRSSRVIETQAIGGARDQPGYLNAVVRCAAQFGCRQAIGKLLEIELRCGRRRESRWGPRLIDLDLLLFGDEVLSEPGIEVPHPRMTLRRFVLEPACEVAGQMRHPLSGVTLAQVVDTIRSARRSSIAWLAANQSEPERFLKDLGEHGSRCQIVTLDDLVDTEESEAGGTAWRNVIVDKPLQLERLDWIPELVVCDRTATTTTAMIAAAQRFPGATLVLSTNRSEAHAEFRAALESVPEFRL